jgi:RNA polymerase sigma-70 factor (ECF subfamily)
VAIDRFRRARAEAPWSRGERRAGTGGAVLGGGGIAQEERAEAAELYWAAYRRLQREHLNEASAWDLYHHQDLDDHQEVAKRLGITVTNLYKRVSRAQAYLKAYLLELGGEG